MMVEKDIPTTETIMMATVINTIEIPTDLEIVVILIQTITIPLRIMMDIEIMAAKTIIDPIRVNRVLNTLNCKCI